VAVFGWRGIHVKRLITEYLQKLFFVNFRFRGFGVGCSPTAPHPSGHPCNKWLRFFKFNNSLRGGYCDYSPRASKNLVTPVGAPRSQFFRLLNVFINRGFSMEEILGNTTLRCYKVRIMYANRPDGSPVTSLWIKMCCHFVKMYITSQFLSHQIGIYTAIILFVVTMDDLIHETPGRCRCTPSVFWFGVQYLARRTC
jgi:hypothetical protein